MNTVRLMCAVVLVVLVGCEFSPYPLSETPDATDPDVAGVWLWSTPDDDDESVGRVLIVPFSEDEFYLETSDMADSVVFDDIIRFKAFTTNVGGRSVANLYLLGSDPAEYYFHEYEILSPDTIEMRTVRDPWLRKFADLESVGEVAAMYEASMSDTSFYTDPSYLVRIGSVE